MLEVDDHLIMDGQDIGQALGYDAAFGFARIGGQSFYFFEQDGLVQISYGGQVLPNVYETGLPQPLLRGGPSTTSRPARTRSGSTPYGRVSGTGSRPVWTGDMNNGARKIIP